jgi:putative RecB family exonuclease
VNISYSQFSTYTRCPHRYWLQYIEKVAVPTAPELHFGAAVHDALNRMYDPGQLQRPSLEEVVQAFLRAWQRRSEQIPEEKRQAFFEEAVRLLTMHYERHSQPEEGRRTATTEQMFSVPLDGGHTLTGRIDRIDVVGENQLEVIDYKTSRKMPPITQVQQDPQLALYRMAANKLYPGFEVTTTLFYVMHDYQMKLTQSEEFLRETKDAILDAIVSIELEEFDTKHGPHCDWCAYQPHCLLYRAPVEPENLEVDIAAALRDYAEADSSEKEAHARKEQAKLLIHRYLDLCQAERVETAGYLAVRSSSKRATGWDCERLRELLEPLGKWEAVTPVNSTALKKILGAKGFPQDLRRAIEELTTYAEMRILRVKAAADDEDTEETE